MVGKSIKIKKKLNIVYETIDMGNGVQMTVAVNKDKLNDEKTDWVLDKDGNSLIEKPKQ